MTELMNNIIAYTWLIPLFPLLGFLLTLLFGKKGPYKGAFISILAIIASFILSLLAAIWTVKEAFSYHEFIPYAKSVLWATVGDTQIYMGFIVDQLTVMMLIVVTVVSALVHIYSVGYMQGDERYPRYFAYLSLFSAAMLSLVIADNLLLFFASWEIVGLASYLLIGFWFERPSAMRAAKKAFIVTKVGDIGLLLGILLIFWYTKELNIRNLLDMVPSLVSETVNIGYYSIPFLPLVGLLLFTGAVGKSAQFPLHVWLPDAMEGPTPVSALIHAATMVAAGVYLVGRLYGIFAFEPGSITLIVIAIIGGITTLFAATIATVQYDIKRVLAYSTISQLGYMMLALGCGGYTAGLFHLMTHAFFKANLFLGSGSVIHGTGTQDMREMGGLAKKMPKTYWTFLIGAAALAGIPLTAGFFSKDEILLDVFHVSKPLFAIGLATAFLTAFYMTRLIALTFWGEPRKHDVHAHESPANMTIPLIILAALSILAGYVALPGMNCFHHFIHFGEGEAEFSLLIATATSLTAFAGIFLGWLIYVKKAIPSSLLRLKLPFVYNVLINKYYVDEFYWIVLVKPMFWMSSLMSNVDRYIVDGIVNGVAYITLIISRINAFIDKWVVDGIVNLIGIFTRLSGKVLSFAQTGSVQNYLLAVFTGILLIAVAFLYRWV